MPNFRYIVRLIPILILVAGIYQIMRTRNEDRPPMYGTATVYDGVLGHNDGQRNTASWEMCAHFYQTVCRRRDVTNDPTGLVQLDIRGEVEALRLYEKIIHQYPNWTPEQVDDELVKKIYTPERRKRLEDTYRWVLTKMEEWVDHQKPEVFSDAIKVRLKKRLNDTVLEIPPPAAMYANEPDLFTKNDVYYETLGNDRRVIRVGGAYILTAKSWFNRVFTFAHELSHAIDPCELAAAEIPVPSFQGLTSCFRSQKYIKEGQAIEKCSVENPIGEAFADWLATDITVAALKEYRPKFTSPTETVNSVMNAVRDLCNQESTFSASDTHPEPETRIGKIYGAHPGILELLGCRDRTDKGNYCQFGGEK